MIEILGSGKSILLQWLGQSRARRLGGRLRDLLAGRRVEMLEEKESGLPDLLTVPAGQFTMGTSDENEIELSKQNVTIWKDEKPAHQVAITCDFRVSKFPVTNAEFEVFLQAGGYHLARFGECWSQDGRAWRQAPGSPTGPFIPKNHVRESRIGLPDARWRSAATLLAPGMDFSASVAPFILRGVTLAGIDSVMAPKADRLAAWERLAADLDPAKLELITHEIGLASAIQAGHDIVAGKVRGRLVVNVNA